MLGGLPQSRFGARAEAWVGGGLGGKAVMVSEAVGPGRGRANNLNLLQVAGEGWGPLCGGPGCPWGRG